MSRDFRMFACLLCAAALANLASAQTIQINRENKTIAITIKWPACQTWLIIARRESFHGSKTANRER